MLESFLKIINHEPADEVVWTADLSYWISARQRQSREPLPYSTEEGLLQFSRELGVMPYYDYSQFWAGRSVYDASVTVAVEEKGADTVTRWRTPVGELTAVSTYLAGSDSAATTRYPVRNAEDLRVLAYVLEHRHLEPDNLESYPRRRELWAKYDGLPCLALPRSPLPALFVEWTGVENGVLLLMDEPALVEEVLQRLAAEEEPIIAALGDLQPPLVHFPDNLTSETFTGFFDTHMAAHYRRRLAALHSAGIRTAVHLDGTTRGLLPKLAAAGFDAIEALTPTPAGDLPVEAMRAAAKNDEVVLWGGVPGAMFAAGYTWEYMARHVRGVLDVWRGTGFVLGVADQVPPDGDISFCRRITDLLRRR